MKKVAVVLCGAGRFDGSEIHESVLTLLHLSRAGAVVRCFAPDAPLSQANAADFDALILPGGSGAAHNLCNFAVAGGQGKVDPDLQRLITAFHSGAKPIGAICIAPALVALALGPKAASASGSNSTVQPTTRLELTLGPSDQDPALEAEKTGVKMIDCSVDQIHIDAANRLVSTPAYILGPDIAAVDQGIGKLVNQVLEMCA